MKKQILSLAILIVVCAGRAHAQAVAVTGNLRDLGLNNATQQNTYVLFSLQNFDSVIPRVVGTNAIVSAKSPPFKPDSNGNISGNIQSNDSITPNTTFYRVCIFFQGTQFQCNNYTINFSAGPTWNLNTATPITPLPPLPTNNQAANVVYGGPCSGSPAGPVFRLLCGNDLPNPTGSTKGGVQSQSCISGSHIVSINADGSATCSMDGGGGGGTGLSSNNVWTGQNIFQGVDPHVDVAAFGARAFSGGTGLTMTASCAASLAVTTSAAGFLLNDGIEIDGCGPTPTMGTPSAPTVTPSTAASPTGTGWDTSIPAAMVGASSYSYKVVARDQFGGVSAASTTTTIATGQATLGLINTYVISSISRTNDVITVTTTANNLMNTGTPSTSGTLVHIVAGSGANTFTGWYVVCSRTSNTTFTLCNTPIDSRSQGWTAFDTVSQSSGSIAIYSVNHVTVPALTGAWEYFGCVQRPGDAGFHLYAVSKPQGLSSGYQDLSLDDFGSPYMDGQTYPRYLLTTGDVPDTGGGGSAAAVNAVCTGAVARNQMYSGTVTAVSAGTNLTVSPATSQNASGKFAAVDASPRILAAANYSNPNQNGGATEGHVYIPGTSLSSTGRCFFIYYPLLIPAQTAIDQDGTLCAYETINLQGASTWNGLNCVTGGAPQFGQASDCAVLGFTSSEPIFYLRNQGNYLNSLSLQIFNVINGGTGVVIDNGQYTQFHNVSFVGPVVATDRLSMNLVARSTTGTIEQLICEHCSFTGGPDQVIDKSWTPLFWVPPGQNGSGGGASEQMYIRMTDSTTNRRGFCVTNNNTGVGPANIEMDANYRQGGIMPYWCIVTPSQTTQIKMTNMSQDTEGNPILACLIPSGGCGNVEVSMATGSVSNALFSGARPSSVKLSLFGASGGNYSYQLPNRNATHQGTQYGVWAPFETSGSFLPAQEDVETILEPIHMPGGQSWYFDISQPTSVTATAAAGGSVPAGTWYYSISAAGGLDNGESIGSLPSNTVTTAGGGNQTVNLTWTNPFGSQSSNVYRCPNGAACLNDGVVSPGGGWVRVALHVTGASYSDTNASGTSVQPPYVTGTGFGANKSLASWPYFQCPETTAPPGIANWDMFYCNLASHRPGFIANNGTPDLFVGQNTTDTLTQKTFDTAGAGNVLKINGNQVAAVSGNTNKVQLESGATTTNDAVKFDANGNTVDAGLVGTLNVCATVQIALSTGAISSGTRATNTATCTGLSTTTDSISCTFSGDTNAVTGYAPSASGGLTLKTWVSANTINVDQVNDTGGSITPGAATVNCKGIR